MERVIRGPKGKVKSRRDRVKGSAVLLLRGAGSLIQGWMEGFFGSCCAVLCCASCLARVGVV